LNRENVTSLIFQVQPRYCAIEGTRQNLNYLYPGLHYTQGIEKRGKMDKYDVSRYFTIFWVCKVFIFSHLYWKKRRKKRKLQKKIHFYLFWSVYIL